MARDWLVAKPCTAAHNTEFVGTATSPLLLPYPPSEGAGSDYLIGICWQQLAAYLGVPLERLGGSTLRLFYLDPGKQRWAEGDRGTRCFLLDPAGKLTRSLKGVGAAGLP